MRRYLFVLFFILLSANVFANLEITVDTRSDWGKTSVEDIRLLCENVVLHFQEQLSLSNKINGELTLVQDNNGPVVYYRNSYGGGVNDHRIGLSNAVDGYWKWCAMTYEIAHEFCHIIHDFEETSNSSTRWFQEVLAQTANIWAIQRMSETWETRPMKTGLEDYSTAFSEYASFLLDKQERRYSGSASEWLEEWETKLRIGDYDKLNYDVVTQLSYKLLPIFKDSPEAWNAVRHLPRSSAKMASYMKSWYNTVGSEYKRYVENIAEIMGIDIILEDTNNEGYVALTFTHENTNSIVPTNGIREWDGWIGGIWEKTPDGTVGKMPHRYLRFAEEDVWAHWMYSHAYGMIEYDITGRDYNKFGTYFGLANPTCGGGASMQLIAHADNVEIYRSKELYLADHGTYIEFDIPQRTHVFTIEIDDLGNNGCDHYVLGEPKLFYTSNTSNNSVSGIDADVNNDGYVDLYDCLIVRSGMTGSVSYDTDVNNDGVTDEIDLLIVKAKAFEAIAAAAPSKRKVNITTWGAIKGDRN